MSVLAASNVVTNRWLPRPAYVPWNLAVAATLLALARSQGHSAEEIGLGRARIRRGAGWGGMGALAVGAGYGALLGSGRAHRLLVDARLTDLTTKATLWRLLVQIPLGTAVAEEIAFRGVLPILLRSSRHPAWAAPVVTSLLFGLWHLLPARAEAAANHSSPARTMTVTAAATTLAGMLLHRLRTRAGHIAAPIALHVAANAMGLLAVRVAESRR